MSFWDLLSSVLTGGATGLLGVLTTKITDYYKAKQAHKQRMDIMAMQLKEMEMEGEQRAAELKVQKEITADEGDALVQAKSYESSGIRWSTGDSPWLIYVDVFRGITRPGLTWLLAFLTASIYFTSENAEIKTKIVATVLYLSVASVTWWFGIRPSKDK